MLRSPIAGCYYIRSTGIVCHARAAQVGVVNRTRREGEEMMLEATIVLLLGLTDIASL